MKTLINTFLKSQGRMNRLPYFLCNIALWLVAVVFIMLFYVLMLAGGAVGSSVMVIIGFALLIAAVLVFIYSNFMLDIKRFHDMSISTKNALIILISLITLRIVTVVFAFMSIPLMVSFFSVISFISGLIIGLWLLFFRGTVGPNKYGLDPLLPMIKKPIDMIYKPEGEKKKSSKKKVAKKK